MNQIRLEKEERKYFLDLAKNDKRRIRAFIRLSDYMSIGILVQTSHLSMITLRNEIQNKNRKSGLGLFNSKVMFGQDSLDFSPDCNDITNSLQVILDEMIKVAETTQRVYQYAGFDQAIKVIGSNNFPDVGFIIKHSFQFKKVQAVIVDQVRKDFDDAQVLVSKNYEVCRPIHQDMEDYNDVEF